MKKAALVLCALPIVEFAYSSSSGRFIANLFLLLATFAAAQLCFSAFFLRSSDLPCPSPLSDLRHPSFEPDGMLSYRLRGARVYVCDVICRRWRLILTVAIAIALMTVLCTLAASPQYFSTCIVRVQRDITDID